MGETPGYQVFARTIGALPPDTVVYVSDMAQLWKQMTPGAVLNIPEFVHYPGMKHAQPGGTIAPGSLLAAALREFHIERPVVWYISRGEPTTTVMWEHR